MRILMLLVLLLGAYTSCSPLKHSQITNLQMGSNNKAATYSAYTVANAIAKDSAVVWGYVVDVQKGERVMNYTLFIDNNINTSKVVNSDAKGLFKIYFTPGKHILGAVYNLDYPSITTSKIKMKAGDSLTIIFNMVPHEEEYIFNIHPPKGKQD